MEEGKQQEGDARIAQDMNVSEEARRPGDTRIAREAQGTTEVREYGEYRKLGQPADTVSGATAELFEVRPSGTDNTSSNPSKSDADAFKAIAIIALVAILGGIIASQLGLLQ